MSEKNAESQTALALSQANAVIAELEARLDEVNARLFKAEHGKSYFISHALNELNNPLAAIIGLTEQFMSMRQPSWDQVRQSLQWVHDEGSYLEFQLKNLFMAGELEAGVAQMSCARVDVHAVLNAVTTRYLALAQRKGVTISSNGGHALLSMAGTTRHFNTDGAALSLIFANLLDNAVKFSPTGSEVRVRVDINPIGLDIAVESDGPGIAAADQAHVFDRFWQSDDSTTKRYRGLGLGLSVAASCAELLGGKLQLSEAGDAGTRFTLHLSALEAGQLTDAPDDNVFFFDRLEDDDAFEDETF
ncbi:sensor histidine kinase KdpD [Malikia sp.]|uniref:sensor histidine kinase n=1 Tax=Malikia sp. TaxID=2070706 RepID=UPI002615D52C|nr:HAMP domain-containing sensor histidine kinase [Malikia sp.]MDD2728715.1 HAMP domain-containing sensor histidine kinase [Malikia sp.]